MYANSEYIPFEVHTSIPPYINASNQGLCLRVCILRFTNGIYSRFAYVFASRRAKGHRGTSTFPHCPLDTFTPSLTRAAALDPGLGAGCSSSPETRTLSGRGDDTARGLM